MCVAYPEPLVERLYVEVKNLLTSHVEGIYAVSSHSVSNTNKPEKLLLPEQLLMI